MRAANGDILTFKGWVSEVLDQVSSFGLAPVCGQCGGAGGDDQDESYPCPVKGCHGTVTWQSAAKAFWWTIERTRDQLWNPSLGFEREAALRARQRGPSDTPSRGRSERPPAGQEGGG